MFIGRTQELNKLNEMYQSDTFEFVVIYGRRRAETQDECRLITLKDFYND